MNLSNSFGFGNGLGTSGTVSSVGLAMPSPTTPAFTVSNSPITGSGTLTVTANGSTSQYVRGDGSLASFPSLTGYVPYTGATADVSIGNFSFITNRKVSLTATDGNSYIQSAWQSASPAGVASTTTMWFDSTGRINWRPSTGASSFVRTFDATGITADRSWTLPNATTTLAGLAVTQTFTQLNTFSANIATPKITGGTAVGSTLTFQTTTANAGAGSDFIFLGGNNGATELARIDNSGLLKCNGYANYTGNLQITAVTGVVFNTSGGTFAGQFTGNTLVISNGASTAGYLMVGSNAVTNNAAIGQFDSTSRGVLFPRMTTLQKNAIAGGSPPSGLVIYDTGLGKLCVRGAAGWETITSV